MKQEQLNFPHKWDERAPVYTNRVLFVPPFYEGHEKWGEILWEEASYFGRKAPLHIEFCSGNGEWLIAKAKQRPDINWIGVEKDVRRAGKIWKQARHLNNVIIVCGKAEEFCDYYLKEGSIDALYINFPDPWPKAKHAKHRIFQEAFFKRMALITKPGGEATLVTDDERYAGQGIDQMLQVPLWRPVLEAPYYQTMTEEDSAAYGSSYFHRLWKEKGKMIYQMRFKIL